jgi:hypothetical protein
MEESKSFNFIKAFVGGGLITYFISTNSIIAGSIIAGILIGVGFMELK